MSKNLKLFLLLVTLSCSYKIWANSSIDKIAVVDIQTVSENSLAISEIKKSMNILGEKISKDINSKELELKKSEDELLKKKAVLSEVAFEKEADIFNRKVADAQKEIQNRKNKLEHVYNEAIGKVHKVTMDIIGELVENREIRLVLPSSQILFAAKQLNITHEVIVQLNKRLKTVKVNID